MTLDRLLQDFKNVIDEIERKGIFSATISGSSHYRCNNTLYGVMQSLQSKLDRIQPLHLRDFSGHYSELTYGNTWDEISMDDIFIDAGGSTDPHLHMYQRQTLSFNICPHGDMDVVLSSNTVEATYRVNSCQLRAGSSVFRDLIPAARVSGDGHIFRLPPEVAHDTTALAVVFSVLHAAVTRLPERIPRVSLVDIAAVCNDYNCAAALAPWDGKWISQWSYANSGSCGSGYHDLLFVAWVLGQDQIFGDLTKLFAQKGFIKDLGFVVSVTDDMKDVQKLHRSLPQAVIGELDFLQFC
jgi:hypothetical protein